MSINMSKCDGCGEMKPVERIYFKENSFLEFCSDCLWSMTQKKYRLRELEVENARLRTVAEAARRYRNTTRPGAWPWDRMEELRKATEALDQALKAWEEANRDARG